MLLLRTELVGFVEVDIKFRKLEHSLFLEIEIRPGWKLKLKLSEIINK